MIIKAYNFFSQRVTLAISIITIVMMTSQPFDDITRFVIYAFAATHAAITFFYCLIKRKEKLDLSIGSCALILFYILSTLILTAHGDILHLGLSQLHLFFFALNCLFLYSSNELKDQVLFIAKLFIILGLYKIIGSFVAIMIMKYNPSLANRFPEFIADVVRNSYANPTRPNGITVHPNTLGAIITVASWCSVYLIFTSTNKKWIIVSCITLITGILFAVRVSSRTTLLVITAFIGIFLVLNLMNWKQLSTINKKKIIIFISIAMICCLSALTILFTSKEAREYIFENVIRVKDIKTATGRTNLQKAALDATKDKRMFGMSYIKLSNEVLHGTSHTHNPFIQILVSTGVPSLILFSLFFFYSIGCSIYLLAKQRKDKDNLLFACFLVSSLLSLFLQSFFEQFFFVNYGAVPFFAYAVFPFAIVLKTNYKQEHHRLIEPIPNNK